MTIRESHCSTTLGHAHHVIVLSTTIAPARSTTSFLEGNPVHSLGGNLHRFGLARNTAAAAAAAVFGFGFDVLGFLGFFLEFGRIGGVTATAGRHGHCAAVGGGHSGGCRRHLLTIGRYRSGCACLGSVMLCGFGKVLAKDLHWILKLASRRCAAAGDRLGVGPSGPCRRSRSSSSGGGGGVVGRPFGLRS